MRISSHDVVTLLVGMGVILLLARTFAECSKRMNLPTVLGELFLGILLGPTVFGFFFPNEFAQVFPQKGVVKLVFDGVCQLAVMMWLFVSGLEVQLSFVKKQTKAAAFTSITSMAIPFVLGFSVVTCFPQPFNMAGNSQLVYALFFGIAMSVSAIPVISRILMDINLYKTRIGMLIMAAATFDDVIGWLAFSFVLSLAGKSSDITNIFASAMAVLAFAVGIMTIGKPVISRALMFVQKNTAWPAGVLALCLGLGCFGAAYTESIGLHANLGAFLIGIAIGDTGKLRAREREIIYQFTAAILAPLFFVSIGLKCNFIANFDVTLNIIVLFLACLCKVVGGTLGAMMGGLQKRDAMAVGFGLNARGVMEIILGKLALEAGLIDLKMFVCLVMMSLATSMLSAPMLRRLASEAKPSLKPRPVAAHGAGGIGA